MTVYVEIVFISNFLIDAFLGAITLSLTKNPPNVKRIALFSLFGAFLSTIYPLLSQFGYLLKIFGLAAMPVFLKKYNRFREYLVMTAVFLTVTVATGGLVLGLSVFTAQGLTFDELSYGTFPILISSCGLIVLILTEYLKKELWKIRKKNSYFCEIYIMNGQKKCRCKAYYDSGNRVYANNGECVVIVSERIYNMLMPAKSEFLGINTAGGKYNMEITDAAVILLSDGEGIFYKVKAGKAFNVSADADVILHSDMTGEVP